MSENKGDKKAIEKTGFQLPIAQEEIKEAMLQEMEGLELSFDRAKIPSGGGLAFEVPGEEADRPQLLQELVGVMVDHHPVNGYWQEKYTGGSNPPDCSSMDGKKGEGSPGGDCKTCPLNEFGSDEDRKGKACKNMHRIYLLKSGEMLPLLLTLPPTSLKNFSNYMAKRIITKGHRSYSVVTKITLKRTQSSSGIPYSQAQFTVAEVLEKDIAQQLAEFAEEIKRITREVEVMEDYMPETEEAGELPF
ncbi:hypothetical protein [Clostridium formicaceticum]|uniref:Uncharacterized protein n=1 Tax=Clostridium formicaceticum TaxID=1497 RepID=A0AAC9RRY9_9CLOT|nr:hypothetical protein [Clostridium formicaceticum]AOY74711.1 hypothetical protein BJL90_01320 [Clostridium formicaceticum]ARE89090.1 hypothetical protein CLFO_34960 [Clostridium formicaceticum]